MSSKINPGIVTCQECGTKNRVDPGRADEAVCGKCKSPIKMTASPVIVTDRNFSELVEGSKLPVLVDFWAAWCGPCRMIAPIVEQIAVELAGRAIVGKLDVDSNQNTAARFQVQGIPMLLILKNGREVDRIVGVQSKEAILAKLRPHL
ncbi:hypothetical protein BH10ACI2_BH10ACI2_04890 [soil metagenome]